MQALTLTMIVVVTTFEFFATGDHWGRWVILPGAARYVAEALGAAALVYVVLVGTQTRFRFVRPVYWIVFATLLTTIVCGAVANSVEAGPVFAGIRNYLRAIGWFFVPCVYAFTERQVLSQLRALMAVGLIQIPFALQQRWTTVDVGSSTGDLTVGTLNGSGTLSIFLTCGICIAAALFVRRRLQATQFVLLFLLLLLPMTINETKAVIVMIPIGMIVAFLSVAMPGERLKVILVSVALLGVSSTIFVPVYDYFRKDLPYAVPITEFMTDSARIERYLRKGSDVGTTGQVGRVDAIVVSMRQLSADPVRLAFGYGIGNVSESALGHGFRGQYFRLLGPFASTSLARLALELGVLGVFLVVALMWLILRDARIVARNTSDLAGALAGGWVGVVVVMGISMAYMDVVAQASLTFLFWYFSGLIVAARMRSSLAATPRQSK